MNSNIVSEYIIPYTNSGTTITGTLNNCVTGIASENDIYNRILKKLSKKPIFQYKCNNCGGQVELDINNHIFICPYCSSVYAIGTTMIYDAI